MMLFWVKCSTRFIREVLRSVMAFSVMIVTHAVIYTGISFIKKHITKCKSTVQYDICTVGQLYSNNKKVKLCMQVTLILIPQ